MESSLEKVLKYIVWSGLVIVCFVPLIVNGHFFFPYIVPKTMIFKMVVLTTFLAYLWLAIVNKKYRIKMNLVLVLFFSYLAAIFLSSLLGGSFYFSFWSTNERSEGILLLLHLLLLLIVLIGFFRPTPEESDSELGHSHKWLFIFNASFLSSLLVSFSALFQYLALNNYVEVSKLPDWLAAAFSLTSAGSRLTATIGNAGYVAGFLIFNIFFGIILIFFNKKKIWRIYYILGILLQIFIIFNTLTRGAIIALVFSLMIFASYLLFFRLKGKKLLKSSIIVILIASIIFIGLIFTNKEADWVRNNEILERVASISLNAVTAQNRLMTWGSAWQGFKEKPLLGYGYENFYQVFDRYFNPAIYRKAGSVIWFDRAHNIVFDRLITGGIIGLLFYLSMLFLPVYFIWKYFYQRKKYLVPLLFTLILFAYFIQNCFIFEALVTYIPLFFILAFLSYYCPSWKDDFFQSSKPYVCLLTAGVILYIPILFIFSINPAKANRAFIDALILKQSGRVQESYDAFDKLLSEGNHFGQQEYRQHFGEFATAVTEAATIPSEYKSMIALRAEEEFDKQIAERPQSARNYLMTMRFLNKTYIFNVERLHKSLDLFETAIKLSPTRPMTYHEGAYTSIYLARFYEDIGDDEKARQNYDLAIKYMEKGLELNNHVVESYINAVMACLVGGKGEKVQTYLDMMYENGINSEEGDALARMAGVAVNAQSYEWAVKLYTRIVEIRPNSPDMWVNLALAYAYLDDRTKAIEIAERVAQFGTQYAEESALFIQDILDGKYK